MNDAKVINIKEHQKKATVKTLDQITQDELREYLANPTKEPDALASGNMKNIIEGIEDEDEEDHNPPNA